MFEVAGRAHASYTRQRMKNSTRQLSRQASGGREERISTGRRNEAAQPSRTKRHRLVKLGVDVHGVFHVVARMADDARPQAPQRIEREKFPGWALKQKEHADRVVVAYEAGPFGFDLARRLIAAGIECLVVAPQNWDERNKLVRTDNTDAAALVSRLDRFMAGNDKAFSIVRVPTIEQDVRRARGRQREQFRREVSRLICRGRSHLLHFGISSAGKWWRQSEEERVRERIREKYPQQQTIADEIWTILQAWRPVLWLLEEKLHELTRELERAAEARSAALPKGVGRQSGEKIEREMVDWSRFGNRRQVAAYTGLTPRVAGSGGKFREGSISKVGNPRLRGALIEMAWRMVWYQPDYGPVKKWQWALEQKRSAVKRKAIVAIARQLAIDLWRMNTGRMTLQQLKLRPASAA